MKSYLSSLKQAKAISDFNISLLKSVSQALTQIKRKCVKWSFTY